jgi:hypothetical protein
MRSICTLVFLLASQGHAKALDQQVESIEYNDVGGEAWTRWLIIDSMRDGQELLVTDAPSGNKSAAAQQIVHRSRFKVGETQELNELIFFYRELKDRPERIATYSATRWKSVKALWETDREWTWEDEKDYARWVHDEVTEDYFLGSGIEFDCADFAMAVRWVYAHDHGLPVANSLPGSNRLFGNWTGSPAWDNLPTHTDWRRDRRFKMALLHLLSLAYTHSITNDLYPVELNPTYVTPGAILLVLHSPDTGHTQVMKHVGEATRFCPDYKCSSVLWGNEPAAEQAYSGSPYFENLGRSGGGFLRWRWPIKVNGLWALKASREMPGYSLEQYSHPEYGYLEFARWISIALGEVSSEEKLVVEKIWTLISYLSQRRAVVAMGYVVCRLVPCAPGDAEYDDYSTPSRDRRFRTTQAEVMEHLLNVGTANPYVADAISEANRIAVFQFSSTHIMADFIFAETPLLMSVDPRDDIYDRWGVPMDSVHNHLWDLYEVFRIAWRARIQRVNSAQALCFSDGSSTLTCDPASPTIENLNTRRLDRGLIALREQIRAGLSGSYDPEYFKNYVGSQWPTGEMCGDRQCSDYDFIFGSLMDNMSSSPTARRSARFGVSP